MGLALRARVGPPLTALSMAMQLNVDGTDCLHRHKHNFSGGWFVEDCLGRAFVRRWMYLMQTTSVPFLNLAPSAPRKSSLTFWYSSSM